MMLGDQLRCGQCMRVLAQDQNDVRLISYDVVNA